MKLKFINKIQESGDVWSFFFEPTEQVAWIAGQSIRLEIPRKTWGIEERRFTIASAPHEGHIQITTRTSSSDFKQLLLGLSPGDAINGANIEGNFVVKDWQDSKIFIAGGIGITPFRSMLAEAIHQNKSTHTTLYYSSRENSPTFVDELHTWAEQDKTLELKIMPERLTVAKATMPKDFLSRQVFISGPEAMVRELSRQAIDLGLPEEQLKADLFTGNV